MGSISEIHLPVHNSDSVFLHTSSPFYGKRMLNRVTEEYLLEQASSFPYKSSFRIVLDLPADSSDLREKIADAIRVHFNYRKKRSKKLLSDVLRTGWRSLIIAVLFLGLLVSLSYLVSDRLFIENIEVTFRELLMIMGWVALWRPADLLLYEWRPYKREVNLHSRLENSIIA